MAIDNELKKIWEEFGKNTNGKFGYDETVLVGGDKLKCQIEYQLEDYKIY